MSVTTLFYEISPRVCGPSHDPSHAFLRGQDGGEPAGMFVRICTRIAYSAAAYE